MGRHNLDEDCLMSAILGRIGTSSFGRKPAPALRSSAAGCADPSSTGSTVLMGGFQSHTSTVLADTWAYEVDEGKIWILRKGTTTPPSARYDASFSYDSSFGVSILFGGTDGSTVKDDTWIWDGSGDWIEATPSGVPTTRSGHASAFKPGDSGRDSTFIFGGEDADGSLLQDGFRYRYDTGEWEVAGDDEPPRPRKWHSMVYVPSRDLIVLYGGSDGASALLDTWSIGTTDSWTDRTTVISPTARQQHGACVDVTSGGMLMFGGDNGSGVVNNETWLLIGGGSLFLWVQQSPAKSPPARRGHLLVNDQSGAVILFGGNNGVHDLNDAWTWDGQTWTQIV